MSKVWLITGSSRGLGLALAKAVLAKGDRLVATARNPEDLKDLVRQHGDQIRAVALDVTDAAAARASVATATSAFGRLDVVVNNAGYGHFGMIEELTEAEVRSQLETNVFGALWVTQAALPIMRAQGSGHIIQVSSIGGISAFPMVGAYHASKWALEGFSQALAAEVAGFGIHVTLVEPGGFATDWRGPSSTSSEPNQAYDAVREARNSSPAGSPGDPKATRGAILKVVDADPPPLRVFFGRAPFEVATRDYESRLETWREWQPVAVAAQGD